MALTSKRVASAPLQAPATNQKLVAKPAGQDAISLLESDHQQVDAYFVQFEKLGKGTDKKALVDKICVALKVHTQIEEEIFYPSAREKTDELDLLDDALVEHMGAKTLIAQIEAMQPDQHLYDAKVRVLAEQVRHHVKEEQEELFPKVRESNLDLKALGAKLAKRKAELMALAESKAADAAPPSSAPKRASRR